MIVPVRTRLSSASSAAAMGLLAVAALWAAPAQATLVDNLGNAIVGIYLDGNGPSGSQLPSGLGEQQIFLQKADGVTLGYGNVGAQDGLPIVDFQSTSNLNLADGFSNITASSGGVFHDLTISVPEYLFGDLYFSVQLPKTDTTNVYDLVIQVNGTSGILAQATLDGSVLKHNADMKFAVVASSTTAPIASIVLTSTYGLAGIYGFNETKQFEISDLEQCPITGCPNPGPGPVPIPGAVWLFGSAVAGAAGLGKWRKNRGDSAASVAA